MFSGIISAVARIAAIKACASGKIIRVDTPYEDVLPGESIAVNGVCLTATERTAMTSGMRIEFFVSSETCERTNLGACNQGDVINLERALRLSDRLSGHLVQGHVDGLAKLVSQHPVGDAHQLDVELPEPFFGLVIEKGSIALDGISLTINQLHNNRIFLMVIPHTWQNTNLNHRKPGDPLNVEFDMIAKYVQQWVQQ